MRALACVALLATCLPPQPALALAEVSLVQDGQDPADKDPPPDGEKKRDDDDGDHGSVPTPDDPQDIPLPRGYAPESPQPFLRGPALWTAQYVALMGIRGLTGPLLFVPVLGVCTAFATPVLEAAVLTYVGDRVGPYRSSLFWPTLAAYMVHLPATAFTVSLASLGQLLVLVSVPLIVGSLLAGGAAPPVVGAGVITGLAVAAVGLAFTALGVGGAIVVGNLVAPTAMLLAYHLSSKPKRSDDNGTDFPRLLPRGKGLPLPRMFRGNDRDEDEDDEEDGRRTPVSTGVTP